ncbi:MAG: protein O-GlcNAc transferase [Mariniblastus sp.]|jgi:protein O-GlcNAc transferase
MNHELIAESNSEICRLIRQFEKSLIEPVDLSMAAGAWQELECYLDHNVQSVRLVNELLNSLFSIDQPIAVVPQMERLNEVLEGRFWLDLIQGVLNFQLGFHSLAVDDFRRLNLNRPSVVQLERLWEVLERYRQWNLVVELANQILLSTPNDKSTLRVIARASRHLEEFAHAIEFLGRANAVPAGDAELIFELGQVHLAAGNLEKAVGSFQTVLAHRAEHLMAIIGCFVALEVLGRSSEAAKLLTRKIDWIPDAILAYDQAISILFRHAKIDAAEQLIEHCLTATTGNPMAPRWTTICQSFKGPDTGLSHLSAETIAAEFDYKANSIDGQLYESCFQGLEISTQFLTEILGPAERKLDVLDLGCGAGTCGSALTPFANSITGVDVSPKMIRRASQKGGYDRLVRAEIHEFLESTKQTFDLVFASQALVYFGSLERVFSGIHRVLNPGGHLVFDLVCQIEGDRSHHVLGIEGQFRHSVAYTQQTLKAAGLQPEVIERRVPKQDRNESVYHFMTYAKKKDVNQRAGETGEQEPQFRDQAAMDEGPLFEKLCVRKPQVAGAYLGLGNSQLALGNYGDAILSFMKSLDLKSSAETHANLGNAQARSGDLRAALTSFQSALDCNPDFVPALNNAGRAAHELGMDSLAKQYLHRALEQDTNNPKTHEFLGNVFLSSGETEQAIDSFEKSIQLNPGQPTILIQLGQHFRRTQQFDKSMQCLIQAQQLAPENPSVYTGLGETNRDRGHISEAGFCFLRAWQLDPDSPQLHSNLLNTMLYESSIGGDKLLEESKLWNSKHASDAQTFQDIHTRDKSCNRKLRIGFVSPGLEAHPFGQLATSMFLSYDQAKFDFVVYDDHATYETHQRRVIDERGKLKSVSGLSNRKLANEVLADKIDILIDLAGHSPTNRLPMFAMKPAPIQITWLGYPGTTGLSCIDYIIADRHTIPAEQHHFYSEQPLHLPDCFLSFTCPDDADAVGSLPATRLGKITFGCFSDIEKLTAETISIWSRVLLAVPTSRLFLKNEALCDASVKSRVKDRFGENGISNERLRLEGATSKEPDWLDYASVDIALDPSPYSDVMQAFNFIFMGVPVITKTGNRFSNNSASSILSNLKLNHLCATNIDQFVEVSQATAADLPALRALRAALRERLTNSPVADVKGLTTELQKQFREVWSHWCRSTKDQESI